MRPSALDQTTALVTGASSGIGRAFAVQLASRGADLVVVARRQEKLQELAKELAGTGSGVNVEVLVADLADPKQRATVEARLADPERPIGLLVNNAGFGTAGLFHKSDIGREDEEVRLNVLALLRLTRAVLPGMVERRHGAVVNVSSVSGEQPLPGWATYAATKAFVTSFSRAIAAELKGSGVQVLNVLPGFTRTEFQNHGNFGQHFIPGPVWMTAEQVATSSLRALDRGRSEVIPGLRYRLVALASRLSPWPLTRLVLKGATRRMPGSPLADDSEEGG